ncbi:MAG: ribonuclease D [Bacterioplanes sp.]|nr:ribonuclease D [Bacterioplanes sp.]
MANITLPEPVWIASNDALRDACVAWLEAPYLAVDTEFMRTNTFYPVAGLLQIADQYGSYLIDPLEIDCWQPLADVFVQSSVVKVFHACAEDLDVCRQLLGVVPQPLADTQVGAALSGLGASMGFQRLLNELMQIDLSKEETRSNWLQRPLRHEQIQYAIADVHYLFALYPVLLQRLCDSKRLTWFEQDCERLVALAQQEEPLEHYYRKVKLAWKLRPQEQYILQQLVIWREQQARLRNVPRNKVIDDQALWYLARFKARNRDQLAKAGIKPAAIREDGTTLLRIVSDADKADGDCWPLQLDRPLSPMASQWHKQLKAIVQRKAEELGIAPDLLAKKKAIEALIRSGFPDGPFQLPEGLTGWRQDMIGNELLLYLKEYRGGNA